MNDVLRVKIDYTIGNLKGPFSPEDLITRVYNLSQIEGMVFKTDLGFVLYSEILDDEWMLSQVLEDISFMFDLMNSSSPSTFRHSCKGSTVD